ncbi:MAG: FRG domain-containing protein [Alphaproteobacteria bacterium]|nr:FRG domain-containing protein [Alphaproteobacteria bacterium]
MSDTFQADTQLSEADANLPPEPKAPIVATVETVQDFASLVIQETRGQSRRWFRGTRNCIYRLVPSLYRHPSIKGTDRLIELEWELLSEFRHEAPPFSNRLPPENLELLFLMQHYGIPTRLLDWTENPFIALFFALENARQERAGEEVDATVWILDPVNLNKIAYSNRANANRVYGAYADELAAYQPSQDAKKVSMLLPLAIHGVHNSQRIVAQRGSFTIFGRDTTALDQNSALSGFSGVVKQIRISANSKKQMFDDLFNIGVADSVVYPDLDGLGREIRNRRGF